MEWNKYHAIMVACARAAKAYHAWLYVDQMIAAVDLSNIPPQNKIAKIAMFKTLQQNLHDVAMQDFRLAMEAHADVSL